VLLLGQGLAFSQALEQKLLARFSGTCRFRIILSFDPDPEHVSCAIRFHTLRPGEVWLNDDMDTYKEPILTIDV
jgi:hypothetical protein